MAKMVVPCIIVFTKAILERPCPQAEVRSAEGRTRTADTRIFSPVLYQLSYLGKLRLTFIFAGPAKANSPDGV